MIPGTIHLLTAGKNLLQTPAESLLIITCQFVPLLNILALYARIYSVWKEIPPKRLWTKDFPIGGRTHDYSIKGEHQIPVNFFTWYWPGYLERATAWLLHKIGNGYDWAYYFIYPNR